MTYVRDPFDTDQPPCFCGTQSPGPVLTTPEFCPACGDPDKPAPEQGGPSDPLSRPCPYCGAEAGDPCIMAAGLMQTTHYSRDDAPEPVDLGDDPDGDNTPDTPDGPACEWCQRKAHGSCDGWIGEPDDPDDGACRCECRPAVAR